MEKSKSVNVKRLFSKYSLVVILVVIMMVCSFANSNFLTTRNLINVMRQQSVTIMVAFGEMVLIICGHLDLSAGSVMALAGVVSVMSYKATGTMIIAFAVAIGIAMLVNFLNGLMVTRFKAPAFIATLATQMIARGAALFITDGQNVYEIGQYTRVGQGSVGIIPIPVIIMLAAFAVMLYLMSNTRWGRSTYAVGGNVEAANASGIDTKRVIIVVTFLLPEIGDFPPEIRRFSYRIFNQAFC